MAGRGVSSSIFHLRWNCGHPTYLELVTLTITWCQLGHGFPSAGVGQHRLSTSRASCQWNPVTRQVSGNSLSQVFLCELCSYFVSVPLQMCERTNKAESRTSTGGCKQSFLFNDHLRSRTSSRVYSLSHIYCTDACFHLDFNILFVFLSLHPFIVISVMSVRLQWKSAVE